MEVPENGSEPKEWSSLAVECLPLEEKPVFSMKEYECTEDPVIKEAGLAEENLKEHIYGGECFFKCNFLWKKNQSPFVIRGYGC
jgi:hypothetical protein